MKKYKKKPWSLRRTQSACLQIITIWIQVELAEFLPGRTTTAIRSQAWYLRKQRNII